MFSLAFKFKHLNKFVLTFIITSSLLFIGIIYLISNKQKWFAEKTKYYTYIYDSSNISAGVPIKIAGFDIGFVDELKLIKLDNKLIVRVEFYILDKYNEYVTQESRLILYKPVVGFPFFELAQSGGKIIRTENDLTFIPTIRENEIMVGAMNLMNDVKNELMPLLENVRKISEEVLIITKQINEPHGNIQKIIGHSEYLLNNINYGEGIISKLLADTQYAAMAMKMTDQLNNIMEKINITIIELNKIAVQLPEYSKDLHSLINTSNELLKNVNVILGSQNIDKINAMAATFEDLSKNLNVLTANLRDITTRINRGEGTIGKIITYDTVYNNVETIVDDLKSTIKISNDWIKKVDALKIQPGFELGYNFKEKFEQYKISLGVGRDKKSGFMFSANILNGIEFQNNQTAFRNTNLTDAEFDKLKVTFDATYKLQIYEYPLRVYFGILNSNLGVGIDADISKKINIIAALRKTKDYEKLEKSYNPNFFVSYEIYKKINIFSGINSLFNKNEFVAGIKY